MPILGTRDVIIAVTVFFGILYLMGTLSWNVVKREEFFVRLSSGIGMVFISGIAWSLLFG